MEQAVHPEPARQLRVIHVTQGLDVGGLEKLLVEFARHADRMRFALHVVSLGGRGVLAKDVEAQGWPVTALDEPAGLRPGLIVRLARFLRDVGADVVHTHDDRQLIHGTFAARLARVPRVIHTRHGRSPNLTPRQMRLVALAARRTNRFVCVSHEAARLSAGQGVPRQKLRTIWNGIDIEHFTYEGPKPRGPAVLVARLSPEKDVGTLLRAAALVVRAEPAFRLEIAGDGSCLPELQQCVREFGLEKCVTFLGQVHNVHEVLARAGLFVLSSLSEGVSLTLLEAMARGLPVVATDVGGNPEVVSAGETGLLVPAANPGALAAAILRIWRDPESAQGMGVASRRRVELFFEVRRMVAEYEVLYEGRARLGASDTGTRRQAGASARS